MLASTTILLVTKQEETAEAVADVLRGGAYFTLAGRCADLDGLREKLAHGPVSLVLVDLDPEPGPVLRQLEPLVARFAETRFVLLADQFDSSLMLDAMQAGARHLLLKSSIRADLAAVLGRLVRATEDGTSGAGAMITLLSGSGGCGATTLAFNLANELAGAKESLLMDLDWDYGAIAPYLGLRGRYGVGDLLARDSHVDGNLVRSTAVAFSKNLHVLLSPVSTNVLHVEAADYPNLKQMLAACRQTYAHTVIDAPRVPRAMAATLAAASTAVLMVFQLTVKDIHTVRAVRTALLEGGLPESRLVLVANRYDKHCSVTPSEARQALGGQELRLVANDYRTAADNISLGRPLAETAAASPLRRDVMQLIDHLGLAPVPVANVAGKRVLAPQKQSRPAALWQAVAATSRRSLLFPGIPLANGRG